MRPHPQVTIFCQVKEDETGEHGTHFIVSNKICMRCESLQKKSQTSGRCNDDRGCGQCDNCDPCKKGFQWGNSNVLKAPTSEELNKAIPYSTDILDNFPR
jgi:hypothetical protein